MTRDPDPETVATYRDGDRSLLYEIDHLGIGFPSQWGQFAVYQARVQVATFAITEDGQPLAIQAAVRRGAPPDPPAVLPVTTERLIELAREAVREAERSLDAEPEPGGPEAG